MIIAHGEFGIVLQIMKQKLKVQKLLPNGLPSNFIEDFDKSLFVPTYALTNHKAQGILIHTLLTP
jgi:hypothetical protein